MTTTTDPKTFMDRLRKKVPDLKQLMVIYGPEGGGKTTLGSQIGKPEETYAMIGQNDPGVIDLINRKSIEYIEHDVMVDWPMVRKTTNELRAVEHPFKFLMVDQFTSMQQVLFAWVLKEQFKGKAEDFAKYSNGPEAALSEWEGWWQDLSDLRSKMTIIALSHATTSKFDNPEGASWQRFELDLFKFNQGNKLIDFTSAPRKNSSEIGFLRPEVVVEKGKGKGGHIRTLAMTHNAAYDAKNRWGVDEPIDLGSDPDKMGENFRNGLKAAIQNKRDKNNNG